MAGEAKFAFVVAGFGLTEGLIFDEETYASIVFGILLPTIISCLAASHVTRLRVTQQSVAYKRRAVQTRKKTISTRFVIAML